MVLTVVVVGSSVVACVTWVRGGCNRLRRARIRERILSVGVVGSSVVARNKYGCRGVWVYECWLKS
jgi:hypothetical protein